MPGVTARMALSVMTAQRGMMWLLVAKIGLDFCFGIISDFPVTFLTYAYSVGYVLTAIGGIVYAFRVVTALYGILPAIVCSALCGIPCLGTLVILIVDTAAMDWLRKAGFPVGAMGATSDQLARLKAKASQEASANEGIRGAKE